VVLDLKAGQEWLQPGELSAQRMEEFATPFPAERMARVRVSQLINNSRNDLKSALEPQPDELPSVGTPGPVQGELF
jgi:putative SOS response-associated peptidase YedK